MNDFKCVRIEDFGWITLPAPVAKFIDTLRTRLAEVTRERDEAVATVEVMREAVTFFFADAHATPEWYTYPDEPRFGERAGQRDNSEPFKRDWNAKLDRLQAALTVTASITKRLEYVTALENLRDTLKQPDATIGAVAEALSAVDAVKE